MFFSGVCSGTVHVPHESQFAKSINRRVASRDLSVFQRPKATGLMALNRRNIFLGIYWLFIIHFKDSD